MRFIVVAESQEQYDAWLARQAQPASATVGSLAEAGKTLFLTQTCASCHAVGGTGAVANAAPDLTHLRSRRLLGSGVIANTPANLADWLRDPERVKPGCKMPNFNLSKDQVDQLVAYLEGTK
jgi:cytochrome c oxidase subunit 2